MCNRTRMPYSPLVPIAIAKDLDLFDDIPYKYIKDFINDNDDIEAEIEDIADDEWKWGMAKTRFTFELKVDGKFKEFVVDLRYHCNSPMGICIGDQLWDWDAPEEEEEEETDE